MSFTTLLCLERTVRNVTWLSYLWVFWCFTSLSYSYSYGLSTFWWQSCFGASILHLGVRLISPLLIRLRQCGVVFNVPWIRSSYVPAFPWCPLIHIHIIGYTYFLQISIYSTKSISICSWAPSLVSVWCINDWSLCVIRIGGACFDQCNYFTRCRS